ncbi:ABC transporter substrate-binding protein [Ornithinimicrobium faecis]|uniref:ABC transporter substrate-binding protein n=1 Tax=Ornithinimicrobium faecis TaxID=2934158 RepID=UPI002119AE54|nr:ABC transporter substrate-binding protein [Ornithinimicrobium sp. HY1745]
MKKPHVSALAALVAISLSACGSLVSQAPSDGEVFIYATTEVPRHLNPAVQSGLATATPGAQLFASPVRFDDSYEPIPYLAESWDVSEDGETVTLHLVEGALFHDGQPITADDVKFSLNVVKNEHPFGRSLYGPVESVDTPDPHTVIINLSRPHPALMIAMSPPFLPVLPEHVYGVDDTVADHPQNSRDVVGSGPYKLADYQQGQRITLEKFDDFFISNSATPETLIIETLPDENTMALALETGEIHMMVTFEPTLIERLRGIDGVTVAEAGYEALGPINWLEFNTKNEVLDDKRVRQAIAYAIDTDYLIEQMHKGVSQEAPGPIHPSSPYFFKEIKRYERDLEKAEELLDQAGYPESPDGTRFRLTLDWTSAGGVGDLAEIIKANLAEVGIIVTTRSQDFPTWATRVSNYEYDMTMDNVWNWGDPVVGVERTYRCDNIVEGVVWSNMSQYCNPEVDSLFEAAASATDEGQRADRYQQVQEVLVDDLPVYWIESLAFRNTYRDDVRNAPNGIFGVMSPMLETTVGE